MSLSSNHVIVAEFANFACINAIMFMTNALLERLNASFKAVGLAGPTTAIENVFVVLMTRE